MNPSTIASTIASQHGMTLTQLRARPTPPPVRIRDNAYSTHTRIRHLAMFEIYYSCRVSYVWLARYFNLKNHTSVGHGIAHAKLHFQKES